MSLLLALREAVKQAISTLNALRDPDAHFLRQGARYNTIGDAALAYGYNSATISRAPPSPAEVTRMEIVLDWLGWLRRKHGVDEFRRIMDWAAGVPLFTLCTRENCSRRTIMNRIDRSLNSILSEFGAPAEQIETIEEPISADLPPSFFVSEAPYDTTSIPGYGNPIAEHRQISNKVYIAGIGFMRDGKALRDGRYRAERV